jgi:hypothetical protein
MRIPKDKRFGYKRLSSNMTGGSGDWQVLRSARSLLSQRGPGLGGILGST